MKICSRCKREFPISDFYKNSKGKDGRDTRCKYCTKESVYRWRARQGLLEPKPRARNQDRVSISEKCRKEYLDNLRRVPCADCGNEFPPVAMDFDHLPQYEKSFGIMRGWRWRDWTLMLAEIAKCEVVCSNCHRIRTAARR